MVATSNIKAPAEYTGAYTKRKHWYSVLLQATVNHTKKFTNVVIGNVGKDHDTHVLRCSYFFDAMDAGAWVPGNPTLTIEGVQIPPLQKK